MAEYQELFEYAIDSSFINNVTTYSTRFFQSAYIRAVSRYIHQARERGLLNGLTRAVFDTNFCEFFESTGHWQEGDFDASSDPKGKLHTMIQYKLLHDLMYPHQPDNVYDNAWKTMAPVFDSAIFKTRLRRHNLSRAEPRRIWRRHITKFRNYYSFVTAKKKMARKHKIRNGLVPLSVVEHIRDKPAAPTSRSNKRKKLNGNGISQQTIEDIPSHLEETETETENELESDVSSLYPPTENSDAVTIESFHWEASEGNTRVELYKEHLAAKKKNAAKGLKTKKTVGLRRNGNLFMWEESEISEDDEDAIDHKSLRRGLTAVEAIDLVEQRMSTKDMVESELREIGYGEEADQTGVDFIGTDRISPENRRGSRFRNGRSDWKAM